VDIGFREVIGEGPKSYHGKKRRDLRDQGICGIDATEGEENCSSSRSGKG